MVEIWNNQHLWNKKHLSIHFLPKPCLVEKNLVSSSEQVILRRLKLVTFLLSRPWNMINLMGSSLSLSHSISPSLSHFLSLSQMHTHTQTHTLFLQHSLTLSLSHPHSFSLFLTCTYKHSLSLPPSLFSHKHTHILFHSYRLLSVTFTHSHTRFVFLVSHTFPFPLPFVGMSRGRGTFEKRFLSFYFKLSFFFSDGDKMSSRLSTWPFVFLFNQVSSFLHAFVGWHFLGYL